ncbi:MAG TPA: M56 family metallopeptidase [Longimicrobium sp.]|jgi:beta-lactamase regulating signal transducer with metallopeptidase domain
MSEAAAFLLLKSSLVLIAAWVVVAGLRLRRASSAARHLVWTLAVCALLLLPLLSAGMPRWDVRWLRGLAPSALASAPWIPDGPLPQTPPSEPLTGATPAPAVDGALPEVRAAERPLAAGGYLAAGYGIGLALVLGWMMTGSAHLRRMAGQAEVVTDPEWLELMREVEWILEIPRPVRLLRSREASMPMATGILRPAVILPVGADGWAEDRRRVVLLHEAAHIARRDCLTQMFAALACATYWFHPAVWYAARQLRGERELACDDRVIAAGARPRDYAEHLLEIARSLRSPRLVGPATVSMARPSQLEGRLLAVLDEVRIRRTLPISLVLGACAVTGALVLPLAALVPSPPASGVAVAEQSALTTDLTGEFERIVPTASGKTLELDLGAASRVRIRGWDRGAVQVRGWSQEGSRALVAVGLEQSATGARLVTRGESRGAGAPGTHSLEIRVPTRYGIHIRGSGSSLEVSDLSGRLSGSTEGGVVRLAQVGGRVDLSTGGAGASVTDSRVDGRLLTGGGAADIRSNVGDLDLRAGGRTRVEPRGAPSAAREFRRGVRALTGVGRAALHLAEGSVFVDEADEGFDVETGRGDIVAGRVVGHAAARTAAGNVELRGVSGWAAVESGRGDIHVEMSGVRGANLTARAGGVTIVLPAAFAGSIDATSTAGRIESDFTLAQTSSPAGGERRSRAGAAGGRVTISATGPVRIRRASGARTR